MKVLHVNTNSSTGGAAIAARRHCEAMEKVGIESSLLSLFGKKENKMICIYPIKKRPLLERIKSIIRNRLNRFIMRNLPWHWVNKDYDISSLSVVKEADIIYLHWINDFLGYRAIQSLLDMGKPVVWYMHDMWPITGGCHYSFDCREYEKGCHYCPIMKMFRNLPSIQLKRKCEAWRDYSNLILAAPSTWLSDCIRDSALFKGHTCVTVRNVIDTELFRPMNKTVIREELGLPTNKKFIIFSSMGINNPYKGVQYLVEVLKLLASEEYEYIVVGECDMEAFPEIIKSKMHLSGFVSSSKDMAKLYNAADILLITSLAENFPNVVIEAMACGVPCVGFATGGITDQIHHKQNGWIVAQKDVEGLAEGINWILQKSDYQDLSKNALKFVEEECSYHNVLKIHRHLLNHAKDTE